MESSEESNSGGSQVATRGAGRGGGGRLEDAVGIVGGYVRCLERGRPFGDRVPNRTWEARACVTLEVKQGQAKQVG